MINLTNCDAVSHVVGLPEFGATVPNGQEATAQMTFVASETGRADAAVCGGSGPADKTDDHGEELIVNVM